jgi:hypothetical protein
MTGRTTLLLRADYEMNQLLCQAKLLSSLISQRTAVAARMVTFLIKP